MSARSADERLKEIAEVLRAGGESPSVTVRTFLSWFGAQRRGYWIVRAARSALKPAQLRTKPDFESAYIDAELTFLPAPPAEEEASEVGPVDIAQLVPATDHPDPAALSFADPTYRMSKLAAANKAPVCCKPDASLSEAVTIMMANDFSQLPVMPNERDVKGMISWKTIGSRLALGQAPVTAREALEPHAEISADASLFAAIPIIVQHEYALVRGSDQRIVGIVTTTDLSLQFQQLSEPFLLLGEIENQIRRIIGSHFGAADLDSAKDPTDAQRKIESAADLTFGEYQRLLENPKNWERLALRLDRCEFVRRLERVREIRNDVMHFDPDGIPAEDLETLRDFARLLRTLQTLGAT